MPWLPRCGSKVLRVMERKNLESSSGIQELQLRIEDSKPEPSIPRPCENIGERESDDPSAFRFDLLGPES